MSQAITQATSKPVRSLLEIVAAGFRPMPKDLTGWIGVAANNKAHITITTGPTFQRFELITNITDPAKIKRISLELNSREIVALSGTDLKMLESVNGHYPEDGRYTIDFARFDHRTKAGIRAGELVTLPTDRLQMFVEFGDTGDVPTLRSRVLVTPAQNTRKMLPRIYSTTYDAAVSGDNDWDYSKKSATLFIRAMHFKSDDLMRLEIMRNGLVSFEADADDNEFDLLRHNKDPQAGIYHFEPGAHGFGIEGLFPTHANELKFRLVMKKPGSVPIIVEEIEQLQPFTG